MLLSSFSIVDYLLSGSSSILLAFFLGVFCSEEIVGTILFYLRI
jgi:hypothetical protein